MVNFRFHIVSLIAVFLALGLGVLMGSTVLDDQIVSRLDREIRDVRNEASARKTENDRLKDEINRANAYMDDSAAFAVANRLPSVPVAVIAERGVDGGVVDDVVALLQDAGAEVPGVFWLEDKWALRDTDDVNALRDALGISGSAASVRAQALNALVARLSSPAVATTTPTSETSVPQAAPVDVLGALGDAGFVASDGDKSAIDAFPPRPARALVITGPSSHLAGTEITLDLGRALDDATVPSVVAEAYVDSDAPDAPDRGAAVASLRSDDALSKAVSTLDDLELVQGRVTAVIALEQAANGVVGHYGYGGGASHSVPTPPTTTQP
jgi:hypothetical protein